MSLKNIIITFFSILFLGFFFQNCGDIKVNDNVNQQPSAAGVVEGSFCSSQSTTSPATLLSFYVVNLTARVNRTNGELEADSDMDGLTDLVEDSQTFANLGYSSTNRRSLGVILDRQCSEQGSVLCSGSGNLSIISTGFVSSDLSGYNFGVGALPGINSDDDFIPDFVEYLFELDLTRADDDNFSDGDNLSLADELKIGRSPLSPNDSSPNGLGYQNSNYYPDTSVICPTGQTGYHFSISRMTLANTKEFSSVSEPDLNHALAENLIGVFILSTNASNVKELQVGVINLSPTKLNATLIPTSFKSF